VVNLLDDNIQYKLLYIIILVLSFIIDYRIVYSTIIDDIIKSAQSLHFGKIEIIDVFLDQIHHSISNVITIIARRKIKIIKRR